MARVSWLQTNFNGGEWSPLMYGRVDIAKYKNALAKCLNFIPTVQGGLTRRPGIPFVAEVKDSTKATRLQRFEFSITQAYVLEFGNQYVRFYTNDGQLLNAGIPVEVVTPYLEADLFNLIFTQSADTLYITHSNYQTYKLQRLSALSWQLVLVNFQDGPYLIQNSTTTTLTSTAATGVTTVTASVATFVATDVGRLIRLKSGSTWGWGTITAYTDSTHVTVTWTTTVGTTAVTTWRLGLYGTANGYPACVTFHEDRLIFGGCTQYPQRVDGSKSSDYENMSPSDPDGTVLANSSISFSLNSNTVNAIRWMQSDERGLLIGTAGGEWLMRASSLQEAITPTSVQAKQPSTYGSAQVQAIKVGKATLFVQRNGKKLRELGYVYVSDGFEAPDLSLVSEHLLPSAVKQMASQATPQQIVWIVRSDGTLVSISYEKTQEVVGWSPHQIGGWYDSAKTIPAKVESVACIPSPDGFRDEVWLIVNRYVNGANHRYIERMSKLWENGDTLTNANYLDSSATYNGAPTTTVTGLTWLKNETISVLADGSTHPDVIVDNTGAITLNRSASVVQVGYGYNSDAQTMRIEAGGQDGPSQGKYKRIHRVIVRFLQSVGLSALPNAYGVPLTPEPFRSSADLMDNPVGLFTGDKRWSWEGGYEIEGQVFLRQDQPLPTNILMIMAQLETQDGG